jgi:hypothetical protein
MLSTEKPKIIPHPVARIALPVVFGVMIEVACDLLRYVVRYFSTSIYFEETRSVGAAKRLGPVDRIRIRRRAGRSIDMGPGRMAVGRSSSLGSYRPGVLDPFGHILREKLLEAYGKAQIGEALHYEFKPLPAQQSSGLCSVQSLRWYKWCICASAQPG